MDNNPWGGGSTGNDGKQNRGSSGKNAGKQVPNLEDIVGKFFKKILDNKGGGNSGGKSKMPQNKFKHFSVVLILLVFVFVLWLLTGLFTVQTDEQGVVLRLGKFHRIVNPGLGYRLPSPIEKLYKVQVTTINKEEIGYRMRSTGRRNAKGTISMNRVASEQESLMLTGDENIVDINFEVQWKVSNVKDYLFNIRDLRKGETVKAVAESAMREVIGQSPIAPVLSEGRSKVEQEAKALLQKILDSYTSGIEVTRLQMLKVDPPKNVINSYRDVQTARADQQRSVNQAEAYRNDILPKARGEASQITEDAKAYKQKVVVEAEGDAKRFVSIYNEYRKAPLITKKRIYLETLEEILSDIELTIIDPKMSKTGVLPYLPINKMR